MYELETYQALQAGDFELHYLPTVRLVDRRCVGAEALIRWKRDGAWVPPMEFIPNTERTPLAGLITYWVIDTVGVELKHWLSVHPAAHVSINIPPDVLGRGGIEYAMNKAGLHDVRQQIVFEVTERGVPDAQGLLALDHMAKGGMRIALDDVHLAGTNLALLSRCHFELLKIDQVLVHALQPQAPAPTWLPGLRAILAATAVQVVAEGVENEHQHAALVDAGIVMAQGHLYCAALPAAQFIDYFAANGAAS